MFKALTPIIGIIVAIGLFFTYIQPTFKEVKALQDETGEYGKAIEQASALQKRITELTDQKLAIPLADLERLQALLPDRIDEVSALIDLDALATAHHLKLGDISVGEGDNKSNTKGEQKGGAGTQRPPAPAAVSGGITPEAPAGASGASATDNGAAVRGQYAALDISFSVEGTYTDFRLFLADIERSLVLMEVTKIAFAKSEGDTTPFAMSVTLYSLNPLVSDQAPS